VARVVMMPLFLQFPLGTRRLLLMEQEQGARIHPPRMLCLRLPLLLGAIKEDGE
jgi:hypothetical protein